MYRPNFCAECGTKILRLHPRLWSSRSFCDSCARKLRKARLAAPSFAALALIVSGYIAGHSRRPTPPPLTIERRSDSPLSDLGKLPATTQAVQNLMDSKGPSPPTVEADVYLCGARTKKGTPCSRRVHAPVRCWQHKGLPAMLPVEKLLVQG